MQMQSLVRTVLCACKCATYLRACFHNVRLSHYFPFVELGLVGRITNLVLRNFSSLITNRVEVAVVAVARDIA